LRPRLRIAGLPVAASRSTIAPAIAQRLILDTIVRARLHRERPLDAAVVVEKAQQQFDALRRQGR
jgi:hypothetical protein